MTCLPLVAVLVLATPAEPEFQPEPEPAALAVAVMPTRAIGAWSTPVEPAAARTSLGAELTGSLQRPETWAARVAINGQLRFADHASGALRLLVVAPTGAPTRIDPAALELGAAGLVRVLGGSPLSLAVGFDGALSLVTEAERAGNLRGFALLSAELGPVRLSTTQGAGVFFTNGVRGGYAGNLAGSVALAGRVRLISQLDLQVPFTAPSAALGLGGGTVIGFGKANDLQIAVRFALTRTGVEQWGYIGGTLAVTFR